MTKSIARAVAAALLVAVTAIPGMAADDESWAALKKPGHLVLLRHANAPETVTEGADLDLKKCETQRMLDAAGRAHAARIGDEFRKRNITKARLIASEYCRAIDTGKLLNLGPVAINPALNLVYIPDFIAKRTAYSKTVELMRTVPPGEIAVLVTHVGNIQAIAGVNTSSGEMVVVHLDSAGEVAVDGKILVP